jgi:regulatory protein
VAEEAFERGLEALSHKERTTAELVAWLAERDFGRDEIEAAVVRLIEARALDDERFAHEFAADKRELRGWGPERIREALAARGLDSALIEAAVGGEGHEDQLERAIGLLERRGEMPVDERSRARALGYLARRGFENEVAYDAVRGLERRLAA